MISPALQIAVACLLVSAQDTGSLQAPTGSFSLFRVPGASLALCVTHWRFSILVSLGLQQ